MKYFAVNYCASADGQAEILPVTARRFHFYRAACSQLDWTRWPIVPLFYCAREKSLKGGATVAGNKNRILCSNYASWAIKQTNIILCVHVHFYLIPPLFIIFSARREREQETRSLSTHTLCC